MERLKFNKEKILKFEDIDSLELVEYSILQIFREFDLPKDKNKKILLKPNLNNDMIALTGGTTDLRIIIAIVKYLKKNGYKNIVIGDGPNTGMYHEGIDVFKRLRIKEIAKRFDINYIDFNNADYIEKELNGNKTRIAKICYDSFFINLPKIKTHTEAQLSCCMKNLVGCNVGLSKRAVHWDLTKNIVELNIMLKPDLNIVDGIVAMEGEGPSKGMPKRLNLMLAGKNSFALDNYISKLTGINDVSYLEYAKNKGLIYNEIIDIEPRYALELPKRHTIINFMLRNYFVLPRYWKMFNWLFDLDFIGKILTRLNIRQDSFDNKEIDVILRKNGIIFKGIDDFCPVSLKISDKNFKFDKKCIKCMYCYIASANIRADGKIGFFRNQEQEYAKYWKH